MISEQALAFACKSAGRSLHHYRQMAEDLPLKASITAHARAIEQHEAFRQEVSDAVAAAKRTYGGHRQAFDQLEHFIIAKTDPVEEAWNDMIRDSKPGEDRLQVFLTALSARGLEIGEKQ